MPAARDEGPAGSAAPTTSTADIEGYVPHPDERIQRYVAAGYWRNRRLHDLVDRVASEAPDRTAVVGPDRQVTYGELAERTRSLAAGFATELGLEPHDRITLQVPNSVEFVETAVACSRLSVVPAFVLPRHRRREAEHVARLTRSRAVVTDAGRYRPDVDYPSCYAEAGPLEHRIGVTADGKAPPEGWISFEELRASGVDADETLEGVAVNPNDPALVMLSGGTSGLPKGIPRTHNDYGYQWERIADALGIGAGWTCLPGIPLGHSFGTGYVLGAALWAGGAIAVEPRLKPDTLLEAIDRTRADLTALIPKQLIDLLEHDEAEAHDLTTLRVVSSGGQKVPPELSRRVVERWGVGFSHVYGMGEGPQIISRPTDPLEVQLETVGRPLSDGDEIRLLDSEGAPVGEGERGELVFRGPGVASAYLDNPEATAAAFEPGGWFHTGDVLSQRPDGNYDVWGRLDDTINRAGETIHAAAVEDALVEHPAVSKAAVVGVPDDTLGERVGAAVELEPGAETPTLEDVVAFFEERGHAVYLRPERLVVVEALPETDVGKIDRRAAREWFEEPEEGEPA